MKSKDRSPDVWEKQNCHQTSCLRSNSNVFSFSISQWPKEKWRLLYIQESGLYEHNLSIFERIRASTSTPSQNHRDMEQLQIIKMCKFRNERKQNGDYYTWKKDCWSTTLITSSLNIAPYTSTPSPTTRTSPFISTPSSITRTSPPTPAKIIGHHVSIQKQTKARWWLLYL